MSLRTFLLVSLIAGAAAWPSIPGISSKPTAELEDCGSEKNAVFKLLLHKITQNTSDSHDTYNPNQPAEVNIMYANDHRAYENIQAEFKYWVNGIPMPSQAEDACVHGLMCPQEVGEHQVTREIQFPTIPGKTKAEVLWKSGDTTLLCIRAMVFVPVLNILRWR
jgi:hypothetical protein